MPLQDSNFYTTMPDAPDYIKNSFAANMIRSKPYGTAPLFGMTSLLGTKTATAVEHGYFSKTMKFPKVVVQNGAPYTSGDTILNVASAEEIVPGELLLVPATNEIVRLESVISNTQISVRRQVGQVAAGAIAGDAVLYSVGNAFEQASLRPVSRLMNPVRVLNFTQIFRDSWALPKTVTKLQPVVGDSLVAESRTDCGLFHGANIERALIFGQRSGQMVNNQWMTTMDGLIETVRRFAPAGNTTIAGATTNYDQLEAMLDPVFDTVTDMSSGNVRTIFTGSDGIKIINKIGRLTGNYQIIDGQTAFGLQFTSFKISRGSFNVFEHPMFNTNPIWKRLMIAVDLSAIKIANLRATENLEYGMNGLPTDNGIDAVGGTLTTELTVENINPSAHAVVWNLTAAAAP